MLFWADWALEALRNKWDFSADGTPITLKHGVQPPKTLEAVQLQDDSWLVDPTGMSNYVIVPKDGLIYQHSLPVLRHVITEENIAAKQPLNGYISEIPESNWCITFPSIVPIQVPKNPQSTSMVHRWRENSRERTDVIGRYCFPDDYSAPPLTAADKEEDWFTPGVVYNGIEPVYTLRSQSEKSKHTTFDYHYSNPDLIEPLSKTFDYSEIFNSLMTKQSINAVIEMCAFLEKINQSSGIRVVYGEIGKEREVQVGYFGGVLWTTQTIRRHFGAIKTF
jgi:hypothetical protein